MHGRLKGKFLNQFPGISLYFYCGIHLTLTVSRNHFYILYQMNVSAVSMLSFLFPSYRINLKPFSLNYTLWLDQPLFIWHFICDVLSLFIGVCSDVSKHCMTFAKIEVEVIFDTKND